MARVSIKGHRCKVTRKRVHEFAPLRTYKASIATVNSRCDSFVGLKGHRCSEHVGHRAALQTFKKHRKMGEFTGSVEPSTPFLSSSITCVTRVPQKAVGVGSMFFKRKE